MLRATAAKRAEQVKVAADVQAWLDAGNEITQLPGFGCRPWVMAVKKERFGASGISRYARSNGT